MGRPRKSTEEKRLAGTLRPKREEGYNKSADDYLYTTPIMIPENAEIEIPKNIKSKYARDYFVTVTNNLKSIHILSSADLPEIETMCKYLERLHQVSAKLDTISLDDKENYQFYQKLHDRLSIRFETLAKQFYVTPMARVQLKIGELQAIQMSGATNKQILINKAKLLISTGDKDSEEFKEEYNKLFDEYEKIAGSLLTMMEFPTTSETERAKRLK